MFYQDSDQYWNVSNVSDLTTTYGKLFQIETTLFLKDNLFGITEFGTVFNRFFNILNECPLVIFIVLIPARVKKISSPTSSKL